MRVGGLEEMEPLLQGVRWDVTPNYPEPLLQTLPSLITHIHNISPGRASGYTDWVQIYNSSPRGLQGLSFLI